MPMSAIWRMLAAIPAASRPDMVSCCLYFGIGVRSVVFMDNVRNWGLIV